MPLYKKSAIDYNNGRGYSQQATAIIQNFVKAVTTGKFDDQTVEAIYKLQQSPQFTFSADGKVGPNTLGYMIMHLDYVGRVNESAVLRNYSYTIQGVGGEVNPIVSFKQWTVSPLMLRTDGYSKFSLWGVFSVSVKFTNVNPKRYEYRQKIKGYAWSKMPGDSWRDADEAFQVPIDHKNFAFIGIHKDHWKEDGQKINGANMKFGYRNTPAYFGQGIADYYMSDDEYFLQDTFGFQESKSYTKGRQLEIGVEYTGCIIDKEKPGGKDDFFTHKIIFSKQWSYKIPPVTLP